MFIRQSAYSSLLLLIMLLGTTSALYAEVNNCRSQNDLLINEQLSKEALELQLPEWESLLQQCDSNPLILHNIAVVNAKLAQWDNATKYFKLSLEKQALAAKSYEQLNSIYRYQAVTAYRVALHSSNPAPKKPVFHFQTSSLLESIDDEADSEQLTVDSSLINTLTEDWIQEKQLDTEESELAFSLTAETETPYTVIHTKQRTYILEFEKSQDQWKISQERSIP